MAKTAVLSIKIISDAAKAAEGLDQTEKKVGSLESRLNKAAVPAAAAGAAWLAMAKQSVDSASELQQSAGAVESIFGKNADAVKAFAATSSTAVGLAKSDYQAMAAQLGAQLGNMGVSQDQLAGKTDELIGLGADLAATFGGSTADAVSALASLMRGERDPIERYGVSIKAADLQARMAATGLDKLEGEAAKAAETQMLLTMLTEQTAGAQGQFARETDTVAGAQQIASARFEDAKAALGERLLPVVASATEKLGALAGWVADNSGKAAVLAGIIGGLSAAILVANAAIQAKTALVAIQHGATVAWTIAQGALNAVMSMNPIGLVVLAVAALTAGVVIAYQKSETFRDIVDKLWGGLRAGIGIAGQVIEPIVSALRRVVGWAQDAFNWLAKLLGKKQQVDSAGGPGHGYTAVFDAFNPPVEADGSYMMTFATPTMVNTGSSRSWTSTSDVYNINVTVNGALDPVAVGEQVAEILNERARRLGTVTLTQSVV